MKLLMFHCKEFWFRVGKPGLNNKQCPEDMEENFDDCGVIFIHIESKDFENISKSTLKAINNITWYARKTGVKKVILHSFAHLSEDKADPVKAEEIFEAIHNKLKNKNLEVYTTPYGCFLEFRMHVYSTPISRVFKSL